MPVTISYTTVLPDAGWEGRVQDASQETCLIRKRKLNLRDKRLTSIIAWEYPVHSDI